MHERRSKILGHPVTIPVSVGVTTFGLGFGLGYIWANRRKEVENFNVPSQLQLEFNVDELEAIRVRRDDKADQEEVDTFIRGYDPYSEEEPVVDEVIDDGVTAEEAGNNLAENLKKAMTEPEEPEPEVQVPVVHNVFSANDDDWDYETEIAERDPRKPYVIHKDEFWAEEMNFTQSTLTYYAGDDIMADEDDTPVYNYNQVIGDLKFGHGSGDPNVFYVRNEKRRSEFEILKDEGLFSEEVLNLHIEDNVRVQDLQHSRTRKFRME